MITLMVLLFILYAALFFLRAFVRVCFTMWPFILLWMVLRPRRRYCLRRY